MTFVGLTRDVEESQAVFVENDGFSVLLRTMQTGDEKLQTKAAFMMSAMCISKPQFKGTTKKPQPAECTATIGSHSLIPLTVL